MGKRGSEGGSLLPIVPRALAIFDCCFISYWDTKWELLDRRESPSQDSPAKFISLPQVSRNKEREYRNQFTQAKRRNHNKVMTLLTNYATGFPLYTNLLF